MFRMGIQQRPASAEPQWRSEEHTSELQSQSNLVCRLLLEKKKKIHAVSPSCTGSGSVAFASARRTSRIVPAMLHHSHPVIPPATTTFLPSSGVASASVIAT